MELISDHPLERISTYRKEDELMRHLAGTIRNVSQFLQAFDESGSFMRKESKDDLVNSVDQLRQQIDNIRFHHPFNPNVPELPSEVWMRILSKLSMKKWGKFRSVCKQWKLLAAESRKHVNKAAKNALHMHIGSIQDALHPFLDEHKAHITKISIKKSSIFEMPKVLEENFDQLTSLKFLKIVDVRIKPGVLNKISQLSSLKKFILFSGVKNSDEFKQELVEMVGSDFPLQALYLDHTTGSDDFITNLFENLKTNKTIKILDLQLIRDEPHGEDSKLAKSIGAMLRVNRCLRKFTLTHAYFAKKGAQRIARGLKKNSSLKTLDFRNCKDMYSDGLLILVKTARENKSLKKFERPWARDGQLRIRF